MTNSSWRHSRSAALGCSLLAFATVSVACKDGSIGGEARGSRVSSRHERRAGAGPGEIPTLKAIETKDRVLVDGRLDEPGWSRAPTTGALVAPLTGLQGDPKASVRILFDRTNIYFAFEVADTFLKSSLRRPDDHLWTQDAVEIMIDPDGDGRDYYEIQASPLGVLFDTRHELPRQPPPFGHTDWSSDAKVKVVTKGEPNDGAQDGGYVVEMAVPWRSFGVDGPPAASGGKPGSWRMNFFVMDATRDGGQRAVAWSPPIRPDFHTLDRFGRVEFVASGSAGPAP